MSRRWILTGFLLEVLLVAVVFPVFLHAPWHFVFSGDAESYALAGQHLLHDFFFTLDGVHPYMDREPVMSGFLALVFGVFGEKNALALVAVQSILLFWSSLRFCSAFGRLVGARAAGICFLLLLTSGSVLHAVFSAYRECLVLVMLLFFSAEYLSPPSLSRTIRMGVLLGLVILSYYSFVLLPAFLFLLFIIDRRSIRDFALMTTIAALIAGAWGLRNFSQDGHFRVIDGRRSAVMWYVRGEQAEKVTGLEPLRCLRSEYVSRDWSGRSSACSYNGVMNTYWNEGFDLTADYSAEAASGKRKILAHFPSYLWFSVFEILELHFPYVGGGWSTAFNVYAALTQLLLGIGFLLGLPRIPSKPLRLLVVLAVYNTLVFILTDATPRYLVPVIFCYAGVAGLGYDRALSALQRRIL